MKSFLQSFSSLSLNHREELLSVKSESMCTNYWLTASLFKLAQEKVWFGEMMAPT